MKRRELLTKIAGGFIVSGLAGCSRLGFSTGTSGARAEKNPPASKPAETPSRRGTGRRSSSGITDLKTLSKLLEQARHPLTEMQVEYLLKLKPGPEFTVKMMDILSDAQKEAVNTAGRGRGRRRR